MQSRDRKSAARAGPVAVAILTVLATVAYPSAAADNQPGAWLVMSTTDTLGGSGTRWRYWFDAQARYFDPGSGAAQYLVRPALGYELDGGATVWIGYARFRLRTAGGNYFDEDRLWQQANWKPTPLGAGDLSIRVRLEQRSVSRGDDLGVSLRLMGKYVQPLRDAGRPDLVLAIEPFFDLVDTDWGGSARLSQNRVFVGIGHRFNDSARLETGYMNQYLWVDSGENRSNHLAILNFRLSF